MNINAVRWEKFASHETLATYRRYAYGSLHTHISDSLTPSNTPEETESSTSETEQDSTEASNNAEVMREQALEEAASLEQRPKRDESPPPNETPPGERYRSVSPSLMEFSTQSSVRQSLLLKRKEMMLQQARR